MSTKTVQCHDCQDTGVTGWSFPCDCAAAKKKTTRKTAIVIAPPVPDTCGHGSIRPSTLIDQRVEIIHESRVIRGKPLYEVRAQDGTTEVLNEIELSMWSAS